MILLEQVLKDGDKEGDLLYVTNNFDFKYQFEIFPEFWVSDSVQIILADQTHTISLYCDTKMLLKLSDIFKSLEETFRNLVPNQEPIKGYCILNDDTSDGLDIVTWLLSDDVGYRHLQITFQLPGKSFDFWIEDNFALEVEKIDTFNFFTKMIALIDKHYQRISVTPEVVPS